MWQHPQLRTTVLLNLPHWFPTKCLGCQVKLLSMSNVQPDWEGLWYVHAVPPALLFSDNPKVGRRPVFLLQSCLVRLCTASSRNRGAGQVKLSQVPLFLGEAWRGQTGKDCRPSQFSCLLSGYQRTVMQEECALMLQPCAWGILIWPLLGQ